MIGEHQLWHGAFLTRLIRSDKPITLRMIETNAQESWSAYTINDMVILYAKWSKTPQQRTRGKGALIWAFTFAPKHLRELYRLRRRNEVYLVLVCGQRETDNPNKHICLVNPDEIDRCIDIDADQPQTLNIKYEPRKELRVWGHVNTADDPLKIPIGRIDKWRIPGS